MNSSDLRDFGLPPRQCVLVQEALQPGEQVRWVGFPMRRKHKGCTGALFGLLFLSLFVFTGLFILYQVVTGELSGGDMWTGIVGAIMFIILPLLPICAILASYLPDYAVYVISNRRAIVCGVNVESWPLEPDMVASNYQERDGSGNLVFAIRWEETRNVEYGFMNIRDVRLVEEILEKAIAERKNA